ncbi:hypothetical protein ACOBWA_09025 [Psychrobacter sp. ER1]|uniref:hypothetical protein n=1 Tax=Psychrobacter sp. ER1 TaxID=3406645 RepID=UPI003B42F046
MPNLVNTTLSIANLIATYIEQIEDGGYKPIHFKPKKRSDKNIEGEEALVDRFNQLKSLLGKLGTSNDEEIQEVPTNEEIYNSETLQLGLLNHVAPIDSIKDVSEDYRKQFDELSPNVLCELCVESRRSNSCSRQK